MVTGRHRRGFDGKPHWPEVVFHEVPALERAWHIARAVREQVLGWTNWQAPLENLDDVTGLGPFRIEKTRLRAAAGGLEALLIPEESGYFRILVDPEPPGGWRPSLDAELVAEIARHRIRFRLAHELGHSFFYGRTARGFHRYVSDSPEQERFCDEFASALLLPPEVVAQAEPTASEIVRLHQEYDVSVEMAARAVTAAHGDRLACWILIARDADSPPTRQWVSEATYCVDRRPSWLRHLVARARRDGHVHDIVSWPRRGAGEVQAIHLEGRQQVVAVAHPPAVAL